MRTSFLHLADLRLGYRDPADEAVFGLAAQRFRFAVDFAVDQRASFVVFSGNLFDAPDVEPDTLHVALRGLSLLAEKNISAIGIRGRSDVRHQPGVMSWYDMLGQEGLLASLEPQVQDRQIGLERWDRRTGRGGFMDMTRCRVFGLHYYGSLTGALLQVLARSIADLDNRETDFRILLLHSSLEHTSDRFGPALAYSDLLLLRRQIDYVGLGGAEAPREVEGWAFDPGPDGFYHVMVDTAVQPKFQARHVPFPASLAIARPRAPEQRMRRADEEEMVFDELVAALPGSDQQRVRERDVLRLVTRSMWAGADPAELNARALEAASGDAA